jgi:hypothetical protein
VLLDVEDALDGILSGGGGVAGYELLEFTILPRSSNGKP